MIINEGTGFDDLADLAGRKNRRSPLGRKTRAHGTPSLPTRAAAPYQAPPSWAPEVPMRESVEEGYEEAAEAVYAEGLDEFAQDDESGILGEEDYHELSEDGIMGLDEFGDPIKMGALSGRKRKSRPAPAPAPDTAPPIPVPADSAPAKIAYQGGGFMDYLPWILGGAVLLGGGVFLYFYLTKKKKNKK